jgi:FixJ family two-component response regulator
MSKGTETVFVIDRDPETRCATEILLHHAELHALAFQSQDEFLDQYEDSQIACLITEIPDDGVSGLITLGNVCENLPVIILSDEADIPTVVAVMKHGVHDFLEKPMDPAVLLKAIRGSLQISCARRQHNLALAQTANRFCAITSREREILQLLVTGKSNKQIATEVGIALKTVQHHRASLMAKTGALNIADLVRLSLNHCAA